MKKMRVVSASTAALLSLFGVPETVIGATDKAPLVLEAKIPLGAVEGRIDHMAFDAKRERLFVAELGNDRPGEEVRAGMTFGFQLIPFKPMGRK
jgi:hypothetical protein